MLLQIENPTNVLLPPEAEHVLHQIFARYKKIIIQKEFGKGLSGGRVLSVRPVRATGAPELPTVVKLAPVSLIEQEIHAYHEHVENRLPNIPPLTGRPVLSDNDGLGGLRYAMRGDGAFEVVSLRDYCQVAETSPEKIAATLAQLFHIMDNIWSYSTVCENFCFGAGYDQVLPVNLLIKQKYTPVPLKSYQRNDAYPIYPTIQTVGQISVELTELEQVQPGDYIRLNNFAVHKVNVETQTITLKSPFSAPNTPSYFMRCHLPMTTGVAALRANQLIESLEGEVLETRASRLASEVRHALNGQVDPTAPSLRVDEKHTLANPLFVLPSLLHQGRKVNIATIHGDFSLENILIEPATGAVSLIDFADSRQDHVLHDFLRLETDVITRLVPEILQRYNLPPAPTLAYLYWHLHLAPLRPLPDWLQTLHPDLQKPWVLLYRLRRTVGAYLDTANDWAEYYQGLTLYLLGALKFKNLNSTPEAPLPKQTAFWGAAVAHALLTVPMQEGVQPSAALDALIKQMPIQRSAFDPPLVVKPQETDMLEKALNRLAEMPANYVAVFGPLPIGSRMPLARNRFFVDRQQEFMQIAEALAGLATVEQAPAQSPSVQTVVITGMGGMGKTQLASEFAHRYGRFFAGGVFWLSFADPNAIPVEVAACGRSDALSLRPDFEELPLQEQAKLVRAAWQSPLPRLLIFDNCETPALLEQWLPRAGGCRVLVTSRRTDWRERAEIQTLALETLNRTSSIDLLSRHRPDGDTAVFDAIAQEVGDLPLALHLAGSFLARYRDRVAPAAYLAELQQAALLQHPSLQTGGASPTLHDQNVSRSIAISFQRLDREDGADELALDLLARAACFAPGEPIPFGLLLLSLNLPANDISARTRVEVAITRLTDLGLARRENQNVRLHRLIAAYVKLALAEAIDAGRPMVEQVICTEAERLNDAGCPTKLFPWQVHLRTVANAAFDRNDEQAARLCHLVSEHFRQVGDYARAEIGLERTLAIRQTIYGEEDAATARTLTDLADVLRYQDKRAQAQLYCEQALAIQERLLGEHPDTATTLNHLGYLIHNQGRWEEALPYHERALAIRRKTLGAEHPTVAYSLCNLAYIAYHKQNFAQAHAYLEEALTVQRKARGEEHLETARILHNLGELLLWQRELVAAQDLLMRVQTIQRKILAKEHPENARVFHNLGEVLFCRGELLQARSYYEAALAIRQKVLGEEHTDTAITIRDLGMILQAQGNVGKAQEYYTQALKIFQTHFDVDHHLVRSVQDKLNSC